jgi:uncharacterized Rmd1/YagE family protein
MWYLRVSNSNTVASTNCFHFTDRQSYERCVEGGKIVFTDAPDSHHTMDEFISFQLESAAEQIATLESRIKSMLNTVHDTSQTIHITLARMVPKTSSNDT